MHKHHFFLFSAVLTIVGCTSTPAPKFDYNLPFEAYQPRGHASDPSTWKRVQLHAATPVDGVEVADGGLFASALKKNEYYLLTSFSVNHLLYPFRQRAGLPNPPDALPQLPFWDTDLRGANAGRFMMGAGNQLRWRPCVALRDSLTKLIDGIEQCRDSDGYIMAYPRSVEHLRSEEPNYARAWFTHGLIDAFIAGNDKAGTLLRSHADNFNRWDELLPRLLHWATNSHQGHIANTRTYLSPVGVPEDLQAAEKYYVCDWWMRELTAHHDSAIWRYPLQNPHGYLITSFEAYLDHYIATGDRTYLAAAHAAWEMIHSAWEHVGGSIAICENHWMIDSTGRRVLNHDWVVLPGHEPHSYYLGPYGHTGELCGSAFWTKLNQRFHLLYPDDEVYASEIEKSIYNIVLADQMDNGLFCYHTPMQGKKDKARSAVNTCCEGQGTRLVGSLPEYIYSTTDDGLYVNLFEPSSIRFLLRGQSVQVVMQSQFPFAPQVKLRVNAASDIKMKLHLRVPAWASRKMSIAINGKQVATGTPGTYVTLSRTWKAGDEVQFTLPMSVRVTEYTGFDQEPDGKRFAVEYGPILLAAIGTDSVPAHINIGGKKIDDCLEADSAHPLQFNVRGTPIKFVPYWQIDSETFTVFPVVN